MAKKTQLYSEAFQELLLILEKIDNGKLEVDELTSSVKKASELIKFCKAKLYETESEIENILNSMDEESN